MSLVTDFSHYYCNTWVALKEGEINHPFLIIAVDQSGRFSREDYSHEAEMGLTFVGQKWFKREDGTFGNTSMTIPVFDPRIIHESPDVGYLSHGRDLVSWTHINPVRQRAKGLMGNKIRQIDMSRNVSGQVVYNLFNPSFDGLVTRYCFVNPGDGKIYYKGSLVGQVDLSVPMVRGRRPCVLLSKFKHIEPDLVGKYTVTQVETL